MFYLIDIILIAKIYAQFNVDFELWKKCSNKDNFPKTEQQLEIFQLPLYFPKALFHQNYWGRHTIQSLHWIWSLRYFSRIIEEDVRCNHSTEHIKLYFFCRIIVEDVRYNHSTVHMKLHYFSRTIEKNVLYKHYTGYIKQHYFSRVIEEDERYNHSNGHLNLHYFSRIIVDEERYNHSTEHMKLHYFSRIIEEDERYNHSNVHMKLQVELNDSSVLLCTIVSPFLYSSVSHKVIEGVFKFTQECLYAWSLLLSPDTTYTIYNKRTLFYHFYK